MRKIYALALCLFLLFTIMAFAEGTEALPTVKLDAQRTIPGGTFEVSVILENNPGIVAMKLALSYDDTYLTLKKVTDKGLLGTYYGEMTDLSDNPYTLCWADLETETDITKNGVIAVLTFEVSDEAPVGDYDIEVSYNKEFYEIMNADLEAVDFAVENTVVSLSRKALISMESVPALAGGEVSLNIKFKNNPSPKKLTFGISFDSELLQLTDAVNGNALSGAEFTKDTESTPLVFTWTFKDVPQAILEDGTLLTLKFKVSEEARKGKIAVTGIYAEDGITDGEGKVFIFEGGNGEINVLGSPSENILGDADGDGKVNSADAIYLSNHLANPEKFPIAILGDVNKDGAFDEKDAIYLLKHTLLPEMFPLN